MLERSGTRTALFGSLTIVGLIGCAPAAPESTPAPAIVAAAQIPPLEVRVEASTTPMTPQLPELQPPVRVAANVTPAPPTEAPAAAEGPAKQAPALAPPTADASPLAYEPPFPNRTDLFVPPKRVGGVASAQNTGDNAVLLMGFVRVDQPKAVLSINGEIAPMAAGESRFGVDVISITPPNVVLQRGRQRWQTTLE
jgi:hypothetical protein